MIDNIRHHLEFAGAYELMAKRLSQATEKSPNWAAAYGLYKIVAKRERAIARKLAGYHEGEYGALRPKDELEKRGQSALPGDIRRANLGEIRRLKRMQVNLAVDQNGRSGQ